MLARFSRGFIVGLAMISAVAATTLPAFAADGCLPPSRAPRGLSDFLGTIRAMTGGGVVVWACLHQVGGRYVYEVKVQVGGKVVTLSIDAATGAPR
jgi:hypothetical protein